MGWNLCPWGVAEEEARFLHLGKPPHQWGDCYNRRGASGAQRKAQLPVWGMQDSETYANGLPQPCAPQPNMCVCQCRWGIGTGKLGLERRPGEGTTVGYEKTALGDSSEELCNEDCSWKKPGPPWNWSTIEWHAKGRATIAASLPVC